MIPAMVARGYPKDFAAGVVASGGVLGILIPPSIVMVLYSVATAGMTVEGPTGERVHAASVDDLFMAGVIPGFVLATLLGLTTVWLARRRIRNRVAVVEDQVVPPIRADSARLIGDIRLGDGWRPIVPIAQALLAIQLLGQPVVALHPLGFGERVGETHLQSSV